jgi:hypothetical protein
MTDFNFYSTKIYLHFNSIYNYLSYYQGNNFETEFPHLKEACLKAIKLGVILFYALNSN